MKLLILGGTVFVGRHLIDAALANGHEVTLFNRGKSGADLYPQLETLIGDRKAKICSALDRTQVGCRDRYVWLCATRRR